MKNVIRNLINKAGYNIYKIKSSEFYKKVGHYSHSIIQTCSTFCPWMDDSEFNEVYAKIRPYTMVDIYRIYELWQLVEQAEKIEPDGDYLEVGVWRGGTSGIISSRLKQKKSQSTLYVADTFSGVVMASDKDPDYSNGEHADATERGVYELLSKKLGITNFKILKGMFPNDTAQEIPFNTKFKMCHIDVDVYQGAKEITEWVLPRLNVGGMIIYDDYGFKTTAGVTTYVEELRTRKGIAVVHNLNGHAVIIKTYN